MHGSRGRDCRPATVARPLTSRVRTEAGLAQVGLGLTEKDSSAGVGSAGDPARVLPVSGVITIH